MDDGNDVLFHIATIGVIAEYQVIQDLMEKKCEVFKACNPSAPCDLVVLHQSKLYRVEVKSWGSMSQRKNLSSRQRAKHDVLAVVHDASTITYAPDIFGERYPRVARTKGVTSEARNKKQERLRQYHEQRRVSALRKQDEEVRRKEFQLRVEKETATCVELRKNGHTLKEISEITNIALPVVNYRLYRHEYSEKSVLPRGKRGRKPFIKKSEKSPLLEFPVD